MIHNNNPPPAWWARVDSIMKSAGVPTRVWTAISYPESSFIPWAKNTADPNGGSYGLFALNLGGQGHGFPVPYLLDPVNNAMIAAKYIGPAVQRCGADNIECIALYSGHPVETGHLPPGAAPTLVNNIRKYFAAAAGLDSVGIYDRFTNGQGVPDAPPSDNPLDPGNIAGAVGKGITGAIGSAFSSFFSAWGDAVIETRGPTTMAVVGVILLSAGIIIAAAKSPPGKMAVQVGTKAAAAAI